MERARRCYSRGVKIGAARLTFHLPENGSLKGKRRVAQALASRLRQQFHAAVAEVGEQERWQTLVLAVVCVSNEEGHAERMLDNAIAFAERQRLDAELVDVRRQVLDGA